MTYILQKRGSIMKRWIVYWVTICLGISLLSTAWAETENILQPISSATAAQLYNPQGNTIAGNPNGNVTLVEFFDYNCPFCRGLQPTLKKLIAKNPNLRVVYKEYLLFGDASIPATAAALAAANQNKYLDMHRALMSAKHPLTQREVLIIGKSIGLDPEILAKNMASSSIQNQMVANTMLASTLNLNAAPAFIITSTKATTHSNKGSAPQYVFMGSDNAENNLQTLIDKVGAG